MIHRAKVLGEDRYAIGHYLKNYICKKEDRNITRYSHVIFEEDGYGASFVEIDENTLAVHMPDFIDSKGNKFFASLNKDGKGADILVGQGYVGKVWYVTKTKFSVIYYENYGFSLKAKHSAATDLYVWLNAEYRYKNHDSSIMGTKSRHYCELEVQSIKE